jgi:hypothetical protein
MKNVDAVSRLDQHSVSNSAIAFAASLILCIGTGKWKTLFTKAVLAFKVHFQDIEVNSQVNQVQHLKER